ncbi:MAG: dynamin family protein [Deltaproteobacteria bacterium]
MYHSKLRTLRELAENLSEVLANEKTNERDEQYVSFLDEQVERLNDALDKAQIPDEYKVAIVGQFKVGKSSFVNVLLNVKNLASVNTNPETAAITIFHYDEKAFAKVHMTDKNEWDSIAEPYKENPNYSDDSRYGQIFKLEKSGDLAKEHKVTLSELEGKYISSPAYVQQIECEDWSASKSQTTFVKEIKKFMSRRNPVHYLVDRLEVNVPATLLQDGIELIDTPGLNDTDRYRVRLTEELVKDVDVILYLTESGKSYAQSDKDFIVTQLRRGKIKHLLIVVTKCDLTFEAAKKDAEESDDEPPTFEEHLATEEKRIREQIKNTLNELLDETKDDEKGYFFIEQLDEVGISFISANWYKEENPNSGISELRERLKEMLTQSQRITNAKVILERVLNDVLDKTRTNIQARLEITKSTFDAKRVRQQLENIKAELDDKFDSFQDFAEKKANLLAKKNSADSELTESKIENIVSSAKSVIEDYKTGDIVKHWRTRRVGRWLYLYDVQEKIANKIFIHVHSLLKRYVERFREFTDDLKSEMGNLQKVIAEIEQSNHLEDEEQSLDLIENFDRRYAVQEDDLLEFINSQEQKISERLESFISHEVEDKIEEARTNVSAVLGTGTTWRQDEQVIKFYSFFKDAIGTELNKFLTQQVKNLANSLEKKAKQIYPELKLDLDNILEIRLKAIESGLLELNQNEKETLEKRLKHFSTSLKRIEKSFQLEIV